MIPYLGSGVGLRPEIRAELFAQPESVDFVEVLCDRYAFSPQLWGDLEGSRERFRHVVPHGVCLSIGSTAPPDRNYLRAIKRVADFVRAPYYSDHLAVTRVPGVTLLGLSPLWLNEETLRRTTGHVRLVQDFLEKPLVLEYITQVVQLPGAGMSTPEFFTRLVEATDCGILLDLTNVHINATNHGFDAQAFIEALPLEAIVQCHLAGGYALGDMLIDGHCNPVEEVSWALLDFLAERTRVRAVTIEHDVDFPPFPEMVAQIDRARRALRPAVAAPAS